MERVMTESSSVKLKHILENDSGNQGGGQQNIEPPSKNNASMITEILLMPSAKLAKIIEICNSYN